VSTAVHFAAIARQKLEDDGWTVNDVEPGVLKVKRADRMEQLVSLRNLRAHGEETDAAAVDRFLLSLTMPLVVRLEAEDVLPLVKDREAYEAMRSAGADLAMDPLAGELVVLYVQDLPDRMRFLSEEQVASVGLSAGQRRSVALKNLLGRIEVEEHPGVGTLRMVTCGGTYESTTLLDTDRWKERLDRHPELGPIIAVAPARDLLMFAHLRDGVGMQRLLQTFGDMRDNDNLNYVHRGGTLAFDGRGWEAVEVGLRSEGPPDGHAEAVADEEDLPEVGAMGLLRILQATMAQFVLMIGTGLLAWRWMDLLPVEEPNRFFRLVPLVAIGGVWRLWLVAGRHPWQRPDFRRYQAGLMLLITPSVLVPVAHLLWVAPGRGWWSWPVVVLTVLALVSEWDRVVRGDGYLRHRPFDDNFLRAWPKDQPIDD